MSEHVHVEDLEVFNRFRAALLKFGQAADSALTNADAQVSRAHSWLENEQTMHWQTQLRKRMEMLAQARDAVRQKKLYRDASGRMPAAIEEEKHQARCMAAVEQAQQKIESVRKWLPRLEKAADQYRGGVSRLATTISVDIPRALALLDRLALSLEEYLQVEAPAPVAEAALSSASGDMSRGPDDLPPPAAPPATGPVEPVPGAPAPAAKEDAHVPHGQ